MVSWTQICAGEQLATMTLLMLYERGCWRGKTKTLYLSLSFEGGWKKVQDIKLLQWTKGCKNDFGEYSKFLENKNWGLCDPEITRTIFQIPISYDQWIHNYERKLIQSQCSTWVGTNRNGRGDASKTPAPPVHQCLCFTRRRWLDWYCKGFKPCATRFWILDQIRKL